MTRSGQQSSSRKQHGRPRYAIALLTLLCGAAVLFSVTSCQLLGITPTPEFSISGVRVAMMPFLGPDSWWYGENPTGKYVHQRAASVLREAGAQLITSEKVVRELQNYSEDTDPPWADYGKRLQVQYVIVTNFLNWKVDKPTAVAFVPGRASMNVQVHDVDDARVAYEKTFEVSVGIEQDSTDIFTDRESTKRALAKKLLRQWQIIFVGKPDFE